MPTPLRLVVGLGNIGSEYATTRHNAGFWWVEALASKLVLSWADERKFQGSVARSGELRLIKPTTYMNLSGRAVGAIATFYQIPVEAILVVHDELDLLPGDAKIKKGGGVAGHNGLKDIRAALGTPEFWRLRLGVGHPRTMGHPNQPVVDYVLKSPRAEEAKAIQQASDRAIDEWPSLALGEFERAIMSLHRARPASTP